VGKRIWRSPDGHVGSLRIGLANGSSTTGIRRSPGGSRRLPRISAPLLPRVVAALSNESSAKPLRGERRAGGVTLSVTPRDRKCQKGRFRPTLVLATAIDAARGAPLAKIGTLGTVFGILGSSPVLQKLLGCSAIRSFEEHEGHDHQHSNGSSGRGRSPGDDRDRPGGRADDATPLLW